MLWVVIRHSLDGVDKLFFLRYTLRIAFQREPEMYQNVQTGIPPEVVDIVINQ